MAPEIFFFFNLVEVFIYFFCKANVDARFLGVTILPKGSNTSENVIIYQRTFSIPVEAKVICFKYECFPKIFVHLFIYLFIHSHILFLFP